MSTLSHDQRIDLPDGADVRIVWSGGNGPHDYRMRDRCAWTTHVIPGPPVLVGYSDDVVMAESVELVSLIGAVGLFISKPENIGGGSLHIVLDDGNWGDDDVAWCVEYARARGDTDGERLARAILVVPETERPAMCGCSP